MGITLVMMVVGVVLWTLLMYVLWQLAGKWVGKEQEPRPYETTYDVHPELLKPHHNHK